MPDYNNGKIYCIRNVLDNGKYYGSTVEPLEIRWRKHKCSCRKNESKQNYPIYKKMNELGLNNFFIELVEEFPCNNKMELEAREKHWIKQDGNINKTIPTRTYKEWCEDNKEYLQEQKKEYRENNKEYLKEQKKEYYEDKKEIIQEKQKQYREENKDKIKERKKIRITCECGCDVCKNDLGRHLRTKKHQQLTAIN